MDIIQAIILGIIQGLTEFLPVSSSAHLVFMTDILGFTTKCRLRHIITLRYT